MLDHGFEHLRRSDDEAGLAARAPDDAFLYARHLFESGLHPEIAARHHHAVGDIEDRFDIVGSLGLLDFGDDRHRAAAQPVAELQDILGAAHERERHEIDARVEAEVKIGQVLLGE